MIDFQTLYSASVISAPFPHMAVSHVLDESELGGIGMDFPAIHQPGVFPLSDLTYGPAFQRLITDIRSDAMREVLEEKFSMNLKDKPLMITVRGQCQKKDGRIHTDSTDKILTCLLYLNDATWPGHEGCLRLLRDGKHLDNAFAEIPPLGGNFVAFRRTDNSWHGHEPFEGRRRYIMFNWLCDGMALAKNVGRHKLSAVFKRIGANDGY